MVTKAFIVYAVCQLAVAAPLAEPTHKGRSGPRGAQGAPGSPSSGGRPIAPVSVDVESVLNILRVGSENPAKDPTIFPPVGNFEGVCFQGNDFGHTPEKQKELAVDAGDPFGESAHRFLKNWIHGDIKDFFQVKQMVVSVGPGGALNKEPRYVLVPGEGAAEKGKELVYQFYPDRQSWGREDSEKTHTPKGYTLLPEYTPITLEQKVYSRFGKIKGRDVIVSRNIRIGTASVMKDGKKVEQPIRIEDFCLLQRV